MISKAYKGAFGVSIGSFRLIKKIVSSKSGIRLYFFLKIKIISVYFSQSINYNLEL